MEDLLKKYTARLCPDNGMLTISAVATSPEQAVALIAAAEGCPTHAVVII